MSSTKTSKKKKTLTENDKNSAGVSTLGNKKFTIKAACRAISENVGETRKLAEFLATVSELTLEEREQIIDQALIIIEEIFVHLPLKRAMYAINPVQQLKLLKRRHVALSERAFHDEMIRIYTHLRDLHTNYILPAPFNKRTAIVPFRLEEFFEEDERKYIVTEVSPAFTTAKFKPGVLVTHWNNIPIDRAVELNAEREAGSNMDARHARGLSSMTMRWMAVSLPPDEERVQLRYLSDDESLEISFDWQVFQPDSPATGIDLISPTGQHAQNLGVDAKTEVERRVLKILFAPEAIAAEREAIKMFANTKADFEGDGAINIAKISKMPDVFSLFREVDTPRGKFGYIRIRTFNVNDDENFIREFIRLCKLLPQNGLILDVRGNGGGLITAGERLLQVLTPKPIEPARFHFINSPLTQQLSELADFNRWKKSIEQSIETGTSFSQGFSLLPAASYNDIGQKYQGPVVLITDSLCYSTTDIFAAGFQDHDIGKILGVSGNTGAGGANVWSHELLRLFFPGQNSPFNPLPKGASFSVAARQTTRVGERMGVPIEDLGVVPDEIHKMTRNDVLKNNVDLINHAAELLAVMPVFELKAEVVGEPSQTAQINMTTKNLSRVDVHVNNRPRLTLDVKDETVTINVPGPFFGFNVIELQGFDGDKLAAVTRLDLL
jgi:hypothetical protein